MPMLLYLLLYLSPILHLSTNKTFFFLFFPLFYAIAVGDRLPGNPLDVSRELLNSAEGARLLSYVEAVKVGEDRSVRCIALVF